MTKNGSDVTINELLDAFTHLADFSLCQNPIETNNTTCVQLENTFTALTLLNILLAILAMLAMQCLQTRVKLLSNCIGGRPGILIPVNLLTHTKHRLIYVAIFGSMSSEFLKVITGGGISVSTPDPYSQTIVSILLTLLFGVLMCISYYPLFASVDTPVPIVGHIIGTVFAIYLFILTLVREYGVYAGCSTGCQAEGLPFAIKVLSDVPIVLLQFFLVLWYLWSIVYDIYVMVVPSKRTSAKYILINDPHLDRVKHHLRREEREYSKTKKGLKKIIFKIYPYDSGFKFPLRFLSGMVVAIVFIYQMSLLTMFNSIQLAIAFQKTRNNIFNALDNLNAVSGEIGLNHDSFLDPITSTVKNIGNTLYGLVVMLTIAMLIGSILCFVQIFLTFRNVSKHLHQSTQRDISFMAKDFPTLHCSLMSSLRYPGYAIAYTVWAWVIYALLMMLLAIILIIGVGVIYYLIQWIGPKIAVVVIGVVWAQLLYIIQFFIAKYAFVMKAYPDSEHKVLNNRRLLHWFSYILLFQNAFVGIFSTFIRIIVSLAFGLLAFSRLDHTLLIRGWEWMDSANKTYMGMIYLDYSQNNSVMNAFCHILLEQCKVKKLNTSQLIEEEPSCSQTQSTVSDNELQSDTDKCPQGPIRPRISQRAYNRWRVAYTLIRNEQLIDFTAYNLRKRRKSLKARMDHLYPVGNDSVKNNEADGLETEF